MATFLGIWNLLLLGVIHCYDNICERSSCKATLSSVSKNLSADKVIDGNTEQDYNSCSHTVVNGAPEAWVMVDLRKEYKLQNVVIYYRNERDYTWRPYRFRQYSLQVSSDTLSWNECYKDNTPDSRIPSSIQNITCARTARYIRIITNYDAPEDDQFSERGAVLEICEIQIFGCDSNHYGSDCSMECSVNCKRQTCDNAKGSCTYGCNSGFYSEKCEKRCSTCLSACNRQSGECEGPCPNGMYGNHCNITCSRNCENGCSKIDGLCNSGCIDGKFGIDCLQTCGGGCSSRCDQADGNCSCKTGWLGQNCNGKDKIVLGLNIDCLVENTIRSLC
ncbi:scavenger receptor class F member 1-like [Saccostrea cucullata]|uniref:scavenger receptor class F member 1-like n=1 Tax=Saccostrea cuccullata TaxID=36930 RepID=UPI002ED53536